MELDTLLNKYNQPKPKSKRPPRSEREEVVETARQINGTPYIQTFQLTKHLPEYIIHKINRDSEGIGQFWWTIFNQKYKVNNMEEIVKEKLETTPAFRERKNRGVYLAILALRELDLEKKQKAGIMMTMNELSKFGIKYDSYRNAWDTVMRKNKHLQGFDYEEGKKLEEKVLRKKGYII